MAGERAMGKADGARRTEAALPSRWYLPRMSLKHVKETFEEAGRTDPMYAVLTVHDRRGGKWDPAEFFGRGKSEIDAVLKYTAAAGITLTMNDALDFGCGVGRLTQALGDHFTRVVGVDISSTMVEEAERHNRHGARVRYLVNDVPDLKVFGDASFDFVYSNITLQHVPPEPALAYIREFVRMIRPGGTALFQVRIGRLVRPGSLAAWFYRVKREYWRRFWQRVRGRIPYEMHFVARAQVEDAVKHAGGRILDVVDMSQAKNGISLRFAVTR
jgi:ubiquinone/menaquinone biosynthesis C-methylase UbiE